MTVVADLGTPDGPSAAADEAIAAFGGRADVLVQQRRRLSASPARNTGEDPARPRRQRPRPADLTVAVLPAMLGGSGSIVSLSSISGVRGTPRRAVYATSKAAIDGMTRALAMVRPRHSRNAVAPGVVPTACG